MITAEPTPAEIRAARERAGLSTAKAAELAGYGAQPRWAEIEAGRKAMDPSRWELFLLRTDQHPTLRLVKRRQSSSAG